MVQAHNVLSPVIPGLCKSSNMLDHVVYPVADYERSLEWYLAALKPLGYTLKMQFDNEGGRTAGLGDAGARADLWIWQGSEVLSYGKRYHIALRTDSRAVVKQFYEAAIAAGGKDNGPPGLRKHYSPTYYGAFVYDPDENNVEVVCHRPESETEG